MTTSLTIPPPRAVATKADALALLDEYLAALDAKVKAGDISQTTRDTYAQGLSRFVDFAVSYHQVSGDVIRAWLAQLHTEKLKPATVNTWFAGVRAFFRWANSEKGIPYNPAEGVKGVRRLGSSKHKRDRLSDSEVLRVLQIPDASTDAGRRDRAYLAVRVYTGVRDIELHRADVSDVQARDGRTVLYVQGKGHSDKDDFVVLMPEADAALRDWLAVRGGKAGPLFTSLSNRSKNGRLSLRAIRWLVKRAFAAAGITEASKTSHSLRHTAISSAIEHGATIEKTRSMARHENISTTAIYYHEKDRTKDPAEAYINYRDKK